MERTRIFSFGKIDYCGRGRKINEVCLEIEVHDWNGYPEFTASADVWNMHHTDITAGGQMIDDLYNDHARFRCSILYRTIKELWEKYHLKDIANIPQEDKDIIELLLDKTLSREEIVSRLKSRNYKK